LQDEPAQPLCAGHELIARYIAAGNSWSAREGRPALPASGCGMDHLEPALGRSIDEVICDYEEPAHAVEATAAGA